MPAGRGGGTYHRETVILADDEMPELTAAIDAGISPYLADRLGGARKPDGSRTYALSVLLAREVP